MSTPIPFSSMSMFNMTLYKIDYSRPSMSRLIAISLLLNLLLVSMATQAQFWAKKDRPLLPEDEAFAVTATVSDVGVLSIDWSIADDYYMYRDQFAVETANPDVSIGPLSFPQGVIEDDPEFGSVEVYFFNAALTAQISGTGTVELLVKGQGCNKPVGVCYPPIARTIAVELPAGLTALAADDLEQSAGQTAEVATEQSKTFLGFMISAFFAGILLSFTPCVLPMIPILAGIIAGQESPSRWRSGWLAICYVAGTVVTYIAAGALAGATGAQLQAWFQNVWVIGAICALLILLALSLFGLFRLELPSSIQTRLNAAGSGTKSASISSFTLGLISALVVGACVSPVLILALGTAITQGDPVLGAAIMGSMATGMGLLLILFGFGAGWLLPRAGAWMEHVQIVFGFMVLGVAIYLLAAFPAVPVLLLWAALLLCSGFYLWSLATAVTKPLSASLLKTAAAGLLIWGGMALVGGASKGDDILQPLSAVGFATKGGANEAKLVFNKTTKLAQVESQLEQAKLAGQPVMLDFYADWCLDCKRMHRTTFKSASVQVALSDWRLIEVDVTQTSADSEAVKQFFDVFGPPATLFFSASGQEQKQLRQYGYINEANFLSLLGQVKR